MRELNTADQFQPIRSAVTQRSCGNCDFRAETAERACPLCRKKLSTKAEVRLSGGSFILLGLINLGVMVLVSARSSPPSSAEENFAASPFATQALYGFLLAFAICGIVWIAFGLLQIGSGKICSRRMWFVIGAVWVIYIASELVILLL